MLRKPLFDPGGRRARARELQAIIRCWPHEAADTSIGGRIRIIHLLTKAERLQRDTRATMPRFYNAPFHKRLLAALDREREAVAAVTRALPADHPMLQLRLIK